MRLGTRIFASGAVLSLFALGCETEPVDEAEPTVVEGTSAEIGPDGGELIAPMDSGFAGFSIKIPPGALDAPVTISFVGVVDDTPLPETAERVGPQITVEPAGTELKKPAELTVPLDPEMLAAYEGTPDTCKVWAREDDGWERVEAIRHGLGSVTVPLSTLTTAAAGVNFTAQKTCLSCPVVQKAPSVEACESISQEYCIIKLPRPEPHSFFDEFASLRVVGRTAYWAGRVDGDPTVFRYDIDDPGPAFVYPPYAGESGTGTNATRGRVAVKSQDEVWASFSAYGNLRFRSGSDAQGYDRPPTRQPAGVMATSNEVTRFARVSAGSNTFDVRLFSDTTDNSKFLFNYAKVIPGSDPLEVNPPESLIAEGTRNNFFFRSIHRGKARGFDPGPVTATSGFWGAQFEAPGSALGTVLDNDTVTFGVAAFAGPSGNGLSAQIASSGTKIRTNNGVWINSVVMTPPAPVRDVTYRRAENGATDVVAIASGREEIYIFNAGGGLTTLALPEDEIGMQPWRIERVEGGDEDDLLLVTRGPLTEKGQFYLIKKK